MEKRRTGEKKTNGENVKRRMAAMNERRKGKLEKRKKWIHEKMSGKSR